MLYLSLIDNDIAEPSSINHFSRFISILDAPVYTIFDDGTKSFAQDIVEKHRFLRQDLSLIPTESQLSLLQNERSQKFIYDVIDKFVSDTPIIHITRLLGKMKIERNITQHNNRDVYHLHCFETYASMEIVRKPPCIKPLLFKNLNLQT